VIELPDPIDRDHVGMLEPRRRARLEQEPLAGRGVRLERGDELHRDRAGEHGVMCEEHTPHRTVPELALDHVVIEFLGWGPFGHATRVGYPAAARIPPTGGQYGSDLVDFLSECTR
jgi:hypothetical protein